MRHSAPSSARIAMLKSRCLLLCPQQRSRCGRRCAPTWPQRRASSCTGNPESPCHNVGVFAVVAVSALTRDCVAAVVGQEAETI